MWRCQEIQRPIKKDIEEQTLEAQTILHHCVHAPNSELCHRKTKREVLGGHENSSSNKAKRRREELKEEEKKQQEHECEPSTCLGKLQAKHGVNVEG